MSRDLESIIVEKIRTLDEEQQKEVLAFMKNLERNRTPLKRLSELVDECFKDVPPEAFVQLPTDGAENHDHYLYGAPKK